MKTLFRVTALALALLGSASVLAAQSTITGVITNVNVKERSLTLRNEETGRFRTYFVTDGTTIRSDKGVISLASLRRGDEVRVTYAGTDVGREVAAAERLRSDLVVPPIPHELFTLVGEITGVRPSKRTITVRETDSNQRLTVRLADDARIYKDGRMVNIAGLERGDAIAARYQVTEQGPQLVVQEPPGYVEVTSPAPMVEEQVAMVELPATGSNDYLYLLAGLGFTVIGFLLRRPAKATA